MAKIARALFLISALWSLVAGAWIALSPVSIITQTAITAEPADAGSDLSPEITVEYQSWFKTQGWWGLAILLVFVGLYTGPALTLLRGRKWLAAGLSLMALLLTWLAGLSIGQAYLPAAAALVLGWILYQTGTFNPVPGNPSMDNGAG